MNLYERALKDLGTKEIPGPSNNPTILKFLQSLDPRIKEETTSWCSAALNYWANELSLPRSKSLAARSWLSVGKATTKPTKGDVVVLWRESPDSWKGHVGIFDSFPDSKHVRLLGANQNDSVSFANFPISRVLSYRRLK